MYEYLQVIVGDVQVSGLVKEHGVVAIRVPSHYQ